MEIGVFPEVRIVTEDLSDFSVMNSEPSLLSGVVYFNPSWEISSQIPSMMIEERFCTLFQA
jgi:hypothetical protein